MVIVVNKEDITDSQYGNLITYLEGQAMEYQKIPVPNGSNVVGLVLGAKEGGICKVCKGSGNMVMVRSTGEIPPSKYTCFECNGTGRMVGDGMEQSGDDVGDGPVNG